MHVFVDENKARGYLVAAAAVAPSALAVARKEINGLRMAGQRRLHFTKERDSRRREILAVLATMELQVAVYDATKWLDRKAARDACLRQVVIDCAQMAAQLLVVERDDSVVHSDKQVIRAQAIAAGCVGSLRYQHQRGHEEPLLAVPDAVAWCWAKGGEWRKRAEPLVKQIHLM